MVVYRILLILFLFAPLCAFAKVSAHVDRTTIEQGETFQLTLQYDNNEPDISKLKQFFNVLGTSQSSKVSIINGHMSRVNEWVVTLSPKSLGPQTIPSIQFGNEATPPIHIRVIKPVVSSAKQGANIFVEVKVDQPKVFVQSQMIYTVRLYRAVDINQGSLTEPKLDNAIVERMGDDVTFQTTRNNRPYQVTERRYAIFPQQSGKLVIPATVFQGLVIEPMPNTMSNDPFNQFFQTQRTRRVRVRSDQLTVQVEAQPASYTGANWLPAKRVTLSEVWSPQKPHFKVGEPVTRTIRLQALGLTGSQLPDLIMPLGNGIKQYTDQPKVKSIPKGNDMLGTREEKFAIIPTTSGKLELPAIHLKWWNTEFNREETATIPSETIEVAPAANVAGAQIPPTNPAKTEANQTNPKVVTAPIGKTIVNPGIWPFIAAGFGFAWLVTLVVVFLVWRRGALPAKSQNIATPVIDNVSVNKALSSVKKACEANNARDTQEALLQWARAVWPESSPRSLEQLALDLQTPDVKQAFSELSSTLYGGNSAHWNGRAFWDNVSQHLKPPKNSKTKKHKSLPGLYPQGV